MATRVGPKHELSSFGMLLPLCNLSTVCHTINLFFFRGDTQTEIAIQEFRLRRLRLDVAQIATLGCADCDLGLRRLRLGVAQIAT